MFGRKTEQLKTVDQDFSISTLNRSGMSIDVFMTTVRLYRTLKEHKAHDILCGEW